MVAGIFESGFSEMTFTGDFTNAKTNRSRASLVFGDSGLSRRSGEGGRSISKGEKNNGDIRNIHGLFYGGAL